MMPDSHWPSDRSALQGDSSILQQSKTKGRDMESTGISMCLYTLSDTFQVGRGLQLQSLWLAPTAAVS